ncbi:MAG: hypothetical protein Q9210_006111 [Variospora velana]
MPQAPNLPHHTTLWKAAPAAQGRDWIQSDGSLTGPFLQTMPGGDFNSRESAYYWTLERATAQRYHDYAATRCSDAEFWMICVQVSKRFIESLETRELRISGEWKEYVWYCKKGMQIPEEHAGLVEGMSEDKLMMTEGVKATQ